MKSQPASILSGGGENAYNPKIHFEGGDETKKSPFHPFIDFIELI